MGIVTACSGKYGIHLPYFAVEHLVVAIISEKLNLGDYLTCDD